MAQNENNLTVSGFTFQTAEEANIARLELEKINMLEKRMDYNNRPLVLAVYNRAVETKMFRTPVGFQYLGSVREKLLARGVQEKELKPVTLEVGFTAKKQSSYERRGSAINAAQVQESKRSASLITSVILNVLLVVLVGVMFIITLYSDNPNILNYKNQILNEYASWEQELRDKESELRRWERELQNAENASGSQNEQN